ncbi:MAG: NUDIX domain-containing protein, partial [Cupriavidus sp.]|nr:NUDIX domain-containing protein [Cupriavidus sp.]
MRFAASMLVLRDGSQGMEILMMRRPQRDDDRSAGAFVFPGGVLDAQDAALHPLCAGLDDAAASVRLQVPANGLDYYLCAVREAFEEANLLFAYDASGQIVRLDDLGPEIHQQLREAASYGGKGLAHVCEMLGLRLAVDQLAYCA